jgi:hypothetical protein
MVNHPILQIASAPVARDVEVDEEDSDGITPLMISCQMGNQQSCRRNSWICHDLPVPGVALLQDCFGPGYLLTLVSLYGHLFDKHQSSFDYMYQYRQSWTINSWSFFGTTLNLCRSLLAPIIVR